MKPTKVAEALLRPAYISGTYDLWAEPALAKKIGKLEGIRCITHIDGTLYDIVLDPRFIPWSVLRAIEELGCTVEHS